MIVSCCYFFSQCIGHLRGLGFFFCHCGNHHFSDGKTDERPGNIFNEVTIAVVSFLGQLAKFCSLTNYQFDSCLWFLPRLGGGWSLDPWPHGLSDHLYPYLQLKPV